MLLHESVFNICYLANVIDGIRLHLSIPGTALKGKPVTIPHDAMLDEKRTQESLGGINIGWFEGFDYVCEKEFSVPQEYEDFRLVF